MVFQSAITWEDTMLRHHFYGSASPWQRRRLNTFEVQGKAFLTCHWEGEGRGGRGLYNRCLCWHLERTASHTITRCHKALKILRLALKKNETTTQWCNSNFRKDAFQLMCMFCFGDKLPEMLLVVLNAKENCIFSVRLLKCLSFH